MSNKNIRKTIRFSEAELKEIDSLTSAHNLTFSEFARSAILKKKINSKFDLEFIFQIKKIGTNLNQIAKAINQNNEKVEILESLLRIEKSLDELKNDS